MARQWIRGLVCTWMLSALGASPAMGAPRVPSAAAMQRALDSSRKTVASIRRPAPLVTRVAPPSPPSTPAPVPTPPRAVTAVLSGRFVAQRAGSLVGGPSLAVYQVPNDCSGLVRVAYQSVGVELLSHGALPGENAVSAIYRRAERAGAVHRGTPRPGDLIFFRDTYDRNRDGVRNDGLTHIGIVERVEADGSVTFVHRVNRGVVRARMDPRAPGLRQRQGRVINETLRKAGGGVGARSTGELFVAYASSARM